MFNCRVTGAAVMRSEELHATVISPTPTFLTTAPKLPLPPRGDAGCSQISTAIASGQLDCAFIAIDPSTGHRILQLPAQFLQSNIVASAAGAVPLSSKSVTDQSTATPTLASRSTTANPQGETGSVKHVSASDQVRTEPPSLVF